MTRFSNEHVWVRPESETAAVVGITAYAQDSLGDIVFVQLPTPGQALVAGAVAGVVESVKTAADVHSPVSGTVSVVNPAVQADPALLNQDPLGAGWLYKLKLTSPAELDALMDEAAYAKFCA